MDAKDIEKQFLKINRTLGLVTGVWPYQASATKLMGKVASLTIMLTAFVTQTAKLVLFFDLNLLVDTMPYYIAVTASFLKLGNYFLDESKQSKLWYRIAVMVCLTIIFTESSYLEATEKLQLKAMLDSVFEDWMAIKSKEERDIMAKYSRRGTLVTIAYLLHTYAIVVFLFFLPFIPPLLDIIHPLNYTRKRLILYPAYYWLDYDKYYVLITAHMMFIAVTLASIFCACDTNYVYAVQHSCGLLAITRYRFRNACEMQDGTRLPKAVAYKNVCLSIKQHQRAIKYLKQIENAHHTYLFISMALLTFSLSISLLQVATDKSHQAQWMAQVFLFFTQLFHLFFLTVQGQLVTNALNDVYNAIYASTWYNSSPETQLLYVLALRSGLSPPLMTAGGLITLNLRSFAEIVKASVSYYTVMQT